MALLLCVPCPGRETKPSGTAYPLKYAGGTLPLKANDAVKAVVVDGQIILVQHGQWFVLPVQNITEIACGTDVRRRFGAALLGFVPLVDLDKAEDHYVGVTWTENTRGSSGRTKEVLFKLSRANYRPFLDRLEHATGMKAVETARTPTVVRYDF